MHEPQFPQYPSARSPHFPGAPGLPAPSWARPRCPRHRSLFSPLLGTLSPPLGSFISPRLGPGLPAGARSPAALGFPVYGPSFSPVHGPRFPVHGALRLPGLPAAPAPFPVVSPVHGALPSPVSLLPRLHGPASPLFSQRTAAPLLAFPGARRLPLPGFLRPGLRGHRSPGFPRRSNPSLSGARPGARLPPAAARPKRRGARPVRRARRGIVLGSAGAGGPDPAGTPRLPGPGRAEQRGAEQRARPGTPGPPPGWGCTSPGPLQAAERARPRCPGAAERRTAAPGTRNTRTATETKCIFLK